jgi:hypothetical protein
VDDQSEYYMLRVWDVRLSLGLQAWGFSLQCLLCGLVYVGDNPQCQHVIVSYNQGWIRIPTWRVGCMALYLHRTWLLQLVIMTILLTC